MPVILTLYATVLALAIWQDAQGTHGEFEHTALNARQPQLPG